MIFLVLKINIFISERLIDTLGSTLYYLSNLGDVSNLIQMTVYGTPYLIPSWMQKFYLNVNLTKEIRNNYTEYNSFWNICNASKQLFENSIPVYEIVDNSVNVEYMSMLYFLDKLIANVNYI